ncbi:MAG: hypothetical protein WC567_05925, partial [Kiritimatiellia bacterium]
MNLPDTIQLETTDCPLCGAGNARPTRFDFAPYKLAHCAECGLYFCATRLTPASAAALYARRDYFEG